VRLHVHFPIRHHGTALKPMVVSMLHISKPPTFASGDGGDHNPRYMTEFSKTSLNIHIKLFAVCAVPLPWYIITLIFFKISQFDRRGLTLFDITLPIYCFVREHGPNYPPHTNYTPNPNFSIMQRHFINSMRTFLCSNIYYWALQVVK
jgi:hypothetical protein